MGGSDRVVIVGAGLAGLCCALHLKEAGVPFLLLERTQRVGGRVKTDPHQGFLLDHGFQVFSTAYPEARRVLDYASLDFRAFYPGARVWTGERLVRVSDPWRRPLQAFQDLFDPISSLPDLLRVRRLRRQVRAGSLERLFGRPEVTTLQRLQEAGFSENMIERFFRPFFGGVFLERDLETSSRMFEFVFRMMASGDTVLPRRGMEEIPRQLASRLPPESIRTGAPVARLEGNRVVLQSEEVIAASTIVLATDGYTAGQLTGLDRPAFQGVTCLYFATGEPPSDEPILLLNGSGRGIVNNVAVLSNVSPDYAPSGQALISVTILGLPAAMDEQIAERVTEELALWFGPLPRWRLLRAYRIADALPRQAPPALSEPERPVLVRPGLFVCGDHRDNASINGSMVSGRRAAEALLASS